MNIDKVKDLVIHYIHCYVVSRSGVGNIAGVKKRILEDFGDIFLFYRAIDELQKEKKIRLVPYEEMTAHEKHIFDTENTDGFYQILE